MSDYLWDKTGEPDAEVERLEALLGTLAHQPRALELPAATEGARVGHAAPFLLRRAPRSALAVAAALALVLLAGAWLFVTRRAADGQLAAASSGNLHHLRDMLHKSPNMQPPPDKTTTPAERPSRLETARVSPPARRRREVVQTSAGLTRKKGRGVGAREEGPKGDLLAVVSERQQTAKAQLVYALRLTGAKLSEVQTKVRGAGEERPASDGRNRIR